MKISQKLKIALLTVLPLVVMTGCSTSKSVSAIDTYCRVYQPVCLSRSDTRDTIDQVIANERSFARLCPVEAESVTCK